MKKLLLVAAIAVFGLSNVNAQENVIKVNPLALLGGTDLVSYERAVGDKSSVVISAAIANYKFSTIKYSSFGGALQYRYYFKEVLKGWYGAGLVSYQSGKTEFEEISVIAGSISNEKFNFSAFGIGVKIGHQWVWDSGFALDLNLGASYKSFNYDFGDGLDGTTEALFKGSGILPTFGFALGYAW